MASLKSLKLRIGSVKSTQKITKALNMGLCLTDIIHLFARRLW